MDPQLPVLKDFKEIEAEPERPERWWVRYFSYAFFCVVAPIVATVVVEFQSHRPFHNFLTFSTALTVGLMLLLCIALCIVLERQVLKAKAAKVSRSRADSGGRKP